ncbi:2-hydroxyacid dehydrogenase [Xinfangfangia sp. CPCC 101601]|uniref:2-hydroxyacid dehydrogenase n=1 Tax=Pseudogemmobacter lacusdianii TaxID=3069608 RepID=A0ABU0VVZ8_9RHOB|nr:2-hydroxyacid dehydrogenase [Xinfangfangia sp. CPCC 101601]MDQ2065894.1 2-hydroxyacid dehydrogenase [Xinfangfangia sp. CPCC 101601]
MSHVLCLGAVPDWLIAEVRAAGLTVLIDDPQGHEAQVTGILRRSGGVSAALMDRFPALEVISSLGVGYDMIDTEAARARGIAVGHTPDVLNEEVADLTMALLLATLRQIPQGNRYLLDGKWPGGQFPLTPSLQGRTIGMIGMGRIGSCIARRLAGFDVPVVYHSRSPRADSPLRHYPDLMEMARDVDTLIAIVPGGPETRHLIDRALLQALGPQGVVINVARGSVLDEEALIGALTKGEILAAGLDVFENEPSPDPRLFNLPNSLVTPHLGSGTVPTRHAMWELVRDNLLRWYQGEVMPAVVPGSVRRRLS